MWGTTLWFWWVSSSAQTPLCCVSEPSLFCTTTVCCCLHLPGCEGLSLFLWFHTFLLLSLILYGILWHIPSYLLCSRALSFSPSSAVKPVSQCSFISSRGPFLLWMFLLADIFPSWLLELLTHILRQLGLLCVTVLERIVNWLICCTSTLFTAALLQVVAAEVYTFHLFRHVWSYACHL